MTTFPFVKKVYLMMTFLFLVIFPVRNFSAQTVFANEIAGDIYTMDMRECELTYLCTSLMFGDIAWQTGNLYGIQGLSLYSIDISNGSATLVATASQGISMPGMVGDGSGNLYMADVSGNLQKFCISTGTFSVVGSIGINCSGDLVKVADTIYMIGSGSTLVKITLNPFSSTTIGIMNFGTASPQAYGMVPSAWHDTLIVSVGFQGTNKLFKVNTCNASVTNFCDSLTAIYSVIFGMATDAEDASSAIPSISTKTSWQFFPNPTTDHLQIIPPGNTYSEYNLQICNINGEVLINKTASFTNAFALDLTDIPAGVYFLSITSVNERKYYRFIVSR